MKYSIILSGLILLLGCQLMGLKQTPPLDLEARVIVENGVWCWFQDERALIDGDKLAVASIDNEGTVHVSTSSLNGEDPESVVLRSTFMADDHNVAGMVKLDNGSVLACYTRHGIDNVISYRLSEPHDTTKWQPEQTYTAGTEDHATYANPFQLSDEGGRIYNFWRGHRFNPTWSASDDGGKTWSEAKNHIFFKLKTRPYVKYTSNGRDTIHFAFTEHHPHPYENSIYHAYYRDGGLYKSDGTFVRKLSEGPIEPHEATQVYNGMENPAGRGWIWDLALDEDENPVLVHNSVVKQEDHRYWYARWNPDTAEWTDYQIGPAGTALYKNEWCYSGGISIDPDDVNRVYLSSNVNIADGASIGTGKYEIYKGVTKDRGATWIWEPVTANSEVDNLRPIVPSGHPGNTYVLWYRGRYDSWRKYDCEVVLKSGG